MLNLEDRVERLERENRRLKAVGLVVVLAVGLVFLMGQAAGIPEEIKARRITAVDANGTPRVVLSGSADAPGIALIGSNGSASLLIGTDAPKLVLMDANGKRRAELNGEHLSLSDADGNSRVSLIVSPEGPSLRLSDVNDQSSILLNVAPDGPVLALSANDTPRAVLKGTTSGAAMLALSDADGKFRAVLKVVGDLPGLNLLGADGESRAELELWTEGPILNLHSADREYGAFLGVANEAALGVVDANGRNALLQGTQLVFLDGIDSEKPIWSAP